MSQKLVLVEEDQVNENAQDVDSNVISVPEVVTEQVLNQTGTNGNCDQSDSIQSGFSEHASVCRKKEKRNSVDKLFVINISLKAMCGVYGAIGIIHIVIGLMSFFANISISVNHCNLKHGYIFGILYLLFGVLGVWTALTKKCYLVISFLVLSISSGLFVSPVYMEYSIFGIISRERCGFSIGLLIMLISSVLEILVCIQTAVHIIYKHTEWKPTNTDLEGTVNSDDNIAHTVSEQHQNEAPTITERNPNDNYPSAHQIGLRMYSLVCSFLSKLNSVDKPFVFPISLKALNVYGVMGVLHILIGLLSFYTNLYGRLSCDYETNYRIKFGIPYFIFGCFGVATGLTRKFYMMKSFLVLTILSLLFLTPAFIYAAARAIKEPWTDYCMNEASLYIILMSSILEILVCFVTVVIITCRHVQCKITNTVLQTDDENRNDRNNQLETQDLPVKAEYSAKDDCFIAPDMNVSPPPYEEQPRTINMSPPGYEEQHPVLDEHIMVV